MIIVIFWGKRPPSSDIINNLDLKSFQTRQKYIYQRLNLDLPPVNDITTISC